MVMSNELLWLIIGVILAFFDVVVSIAVGMETIRQRPLIKLTFILMVISSVALIVFAVSAIARPLLVNINSPISLGLETKPNNSNSATVIAGIRTAILIDMTQTASPQNNSSSGKISIQVESPTFSIPQTSPQPRALREERVELGPYEKDIFSRSLNADEVIIGDAVDVEDRGLTCVVFWARGPGTIIFTMLNGAWDRYSGVVSQEQLDELIQIRYDFLQNEHNYCKYVDIPIIELGNP